MNPHGSFGFFCDKTLRVKAVLLFVVVLTSLREYRTAYFCTSSFSTYVTSSANTSTKASVNLKRPFTIVCNCGAELLTLEFSIVGKGNLVLGYEEGKSHTMVSFCYGWSTEFCDVTRFQFEKPTKNPFILYYTDVVLSLVL